MVGISNIIIKPGLINIDFANVWTMMSNAGMVLMGIGNRLGKTGAEDAAMAAISNPLLDSTINNTMGVIFNISSGEELSLMDVNRAARLIYNSIEDDANVIFGTLIDETLEDTISITILGMGFSAGNELTENGTEEETDELAHHSREVVHTNMRSKKRRGY